MTLQGERASPPISKDRIVARLRSLKTLPTTVAVAVRLFQLQKSEDESGTDPQPGDYARIIATDAGMTARMLALANSSFFGLSVRVTQPMVAVNLLGIAAVRTLAINFCLSGLYHELKMARTESRQLWEASLCKAVAARELARRLDKGRSDEAYVTGLFQDIALPVMYATARDAMAPLLESRLSVATRLQREQAIFSAGHGELGEVFARGLGLPEAQAKLIGAHHDRAATFALAETPGLAAASYAASLFPHRMDQWDAGDVEALREFLGSAAGGKTNLEEFLAAVSRECEREFSYFDKANVPEVKLLELMAGAMGHAAQAAEQLVGEMQSLKKQVASAEEAAQASLQDRQRLAEQASRDPLTGILNRAGFERECRPALAQAHCNGQPVAMLYLDLDNFKAVNDVHGHAMGDDALKQVTAALRECTRNTDVLGRIGGDEFAIMLVNCPPERSAKIGELIRTRVALRRVQGQALSVSVGVRCSTADHPQSLEELLATSDQQMYAAKRKGGGGVSVEVA